ncbi:winged helix-turn-helix domain-containing protein [Streptomycetaceae bacterium NBC_01309]
MRFAVLGPLTVLTDRGDTVPVPEAKVRALLACLLVAPGRVASSDRLVEDLWGDLPPARPTPALQTLVSRLRKALAGGGDLVRHQAPGYVLQVASDTVDSGRFTALADRALRSTDQHERAELFGDALALWRGPAFAEFADEPFATSAAARLEEQRLQVLEAYAETRLRLGQYESVVGDLREITLRHPLREQLRAVLMRALYGAGRPSEALDVYDDLRRHLDEELGLAPSPPLVALQRDILRQAPDTLPSVVSTPATSDRTAGSVGAAASAVRRRTNLPVPANGLIGRSHAVDEVRALLASRRLVTLTGPGGVGKTRLALEIAAASQGSYADGVWLVELAAQVAYAAQSDADPSPAVDQLAGAVAAALRIRDDANSGTPGTDRRPSPHPLADRLAETVSSRQVLLVLDNAEHVVEPVAQLTRLLLRTSPGVRVLATSREPLAVSGEQQWPVPPLAVPAPGATTSEVAGSAAARLFAARAGAVSPGFSVSDANAEAVGMICRRLDGIPLALELASTRIRVLGAAELAARLDDRFGLLTGGPRDAPARQQTLRAMIDWSWELLTAAERTVLRRLAIHADGCTLEAAEALCAGAGVRPAQVLDLLARLVDRSLVVVTQGGDGTRYGFLESVHAYCLEQLRATADDGASAADDLHNAAEKTPGATEYDLLRRAHARYYAALADRADRHLRGGGQQRWLQLLDAEGPNLRAALDTACATDDGPLARQLVRSTAWYWFLRGRFSEARRATATALAVGDAGAARDGSTPDADSAADANSPADSHSDAGSDAGSDRALIAAWHAGMTLLSGSTAQPACGSHEPLKLYASIGETTHERPRAGWLLAHAATMFGGMSDAEELVDRALADFRAQDDRWGIAAVLSLRGVQRYVSGDLAGSRDDGSAGLAMFRETGDRWGQLQALGVLGRVAEIVGDYRDAKARHHEALCIAEDLALWSEASTRRSQLGRIALLTGDDVQAAERHQQGRRLALEHGDRSAQEFAEVGLALGARRAGRLDEAESYLRPWLEWNLRLDAQNGAALILAELGFIAEHRGDTDACLALHTQGLDAARATGDPRAVALALEGLAGARHLTNDHAIAAGLLGTASRLRDSVGAPLPAAESGDVDRIRSAVRAVLDEDAFAAAFAESALPEQ